MSIVLNGTTGITSTNITETADGNVGIGTSSPSNFSGYTTLDVVNATNGGAILARGSTVEARIVADQPSGVVQVKAQSNHPLTFGTSGTERMRIDTAGRVTMPYQPAFYAMMNNTNATGSTYIVFEDVFVNIGGHYNPANGRFTAPVAGTYVFSFNALKRAGGGRMSLHKNSSYYGSGTSQTYSAADEIPHAATVIITLAVNDFVQVYGSNDAGDFYGNSNSHNGFSGHLIG